MIIGLLLTCIITFVNFIFGILAGMAYTFNVADEFVNLINYIYGFNSIFPIDTMLTLLTWSLRLWLVIGTFYFFKWLIHLLRGN
jgi:hypothetical protein